MYQKRCSAARFEALSAFKECIEFAILKLTQDTPLGLECATKDGERLIYHFVLASHVRDISESEDTFSVKHINRNRYPFYLFITEKSKTQSFIQGLQGNVRKTRHFLELT